MATRRRSSAAAACMVALATLMVSLDVSAQGEQAQARTLFTEGEQAYRIGHYEEAVDLWQRAFALDARPRIQYNLSQAFERLGRLQEAVEALDAYIRTTPPDDPLYGEANARLSALRQRVALTGVRIIGGPMGSQIFVDEQAWGATPRPDRIPLAPGSHQIVLIYPNGSRHEVAVAVPVGQIVEVTVPSGGEDLPVISVGDPSSAGSSSVYSAGTAEEPSNGHAMFWAGAGAAAVGAGVLVYGITRQMELSGCSDEGFACLEESTVERQRTLGFVLGGTLLAAGATLITIDLVTTRDSRDRADVDLGLGLASFSLTVRR